MEVFTGVWCPPCANADPPASRMVDEYSPDDFLVLMYHVGSDPYTNAASSERDNFYNIQAVPTMIFDGGGPWSDGTLWQVGAYSNKGQNYDIYRTKADSQYPFGAPLQIDLAADLTATQVRANASIYASDPVTLTNLRARFVLYEDQLYYMGSNGEPYHRAVVRLIASQPLAIGMGETVTVTHTFTLGGWDRNKLGVALLVQTDNRDPVTVSGYNMYKAEVLQAARVDLVPRGIAVFRDEPTTDYAEPFERILSQNGRHFDTTNYLAQPGDTGAVDNRGSPTAAYLADHPMVVWFTGAQTGTLTAAEQTEIQNALGSSPANLVVTGENLGTGIGGTQFYGDVLKATFVQENSGIFTVQGIAADPLSGAWAGTPLSITGTSPDVIDPVGNGEWTFRYAGAATGAAIRSDYDADSRVLYMGYSYFQGTDANRQGVMADIIRWFDERAPPTVTVAWPNGGEVLTSGIEYRFAWSAHDVEIPADGIDVYYTIDSGSPTPTWTLIASMQANDGTTWWTPPAGVDSDTCRLKVVVRDAQGNEREDISDADFTIGSPVSSSFILTLQPGRNLISFPLEPSDKTVMSVLSTIDPSFSWVRAYDATTPSDPWVTWTRGGTPDELNRLDRTMGFWIEVTSPTAVDLTVTGLVPSTTGITLRAGWNLVGFPSSRTDITVASVKTATGATAISGFDAGASSYMRELGGSEILQAGRGYWVYVPSETTWSVAYA